VGSHETLDRELKTLRIPPEKRGEPPKASPRRKWWLYVGAGLATVVLLVLLVIMRAAPVPVEVVRAQLSAGPMASATLIASGYVVPHHRIEVGSKVMGKVAWVGVEKGDRVKAGQVVVRLEDDEYRARVEEARAALATAEARLTELETGSRPEEIDRARAERDLARLNLERVQALVAQGVYAQQQLDDARTRFEVAEKSYELVRQGPRKEQVEQARAEVERARAALAFAETQLEATRIRAPREGTILERLVEAGEMVTTMFAGERGAKSVVVSLADLRDIRVELDINQNDFPRVSMNQLCDIVLEAYPDRHYRGQVVEIAPEANRQKGTVQVKVQFPEPDEKVRPEMIARVAFQQTEKSNEAARPVVLIPRSARVERDGKGIVFLIKDGRARLRPIQASEAPGDMLIVMAGLQGGEEVVVSGQEALRDGARVGIKPSRQGKQ